MDIYEDEHNITLKLEVPGIEEKDIDVRVENTTLTVHGERKIEKEEKKRTSVASSGSTATSPGRSRCPVPSILASKRPLRQGRAEDQARQEGGSQAQANQG